MNRREFLRRAALITAGVVAADQLELLERLAPRRLYFAGWTHMLWGDGVHDDTAALQAVVDGKRVIHQCDGSLIEHGILRNGVYRITETIDIPNRGVLSMARLRMANCRITGQLRRDQPLIRFSSDGLFKHEDRRWSLVLP